MADSRDGTQNIQYESSIFFIARSAQKQTDEVVSEGHRSQLKEFNGKSCNFLNKVDNK